MKKRTPPESRDILLAFASLIIPGLGQLLQSRFLATFVHFIIAALLWIILLGWLMHIYSAYDAANHYR